MKQIRKKRFRHETRVRQIFIFDCVVGKRIEIDFTFHLVRVNSVDVMRPMDILFSSHPDFNFQKNMEIYCEYKVRCRMSWLMGSPFNWIMHDELTVVHYSLFRMIYYWFLLFGPSKKRKAKNCSIQQKQAIERVLLWSISQSLFTNNEQLYSLGSQRLKKNFDFCIVLSAQHSPNSHHLHIRSFCDAINISENCADKLIWCKKGLLIRDYRLKSEMRKEKNFFFSFHSLLLEDQI